MWLEHETMTVYEKMLSDHDEDTFYAASEVDSDDDWIDVTEENVEFDFVTMIPSGRQCDN